MRLPGQFQAALPVRTLESRFPTEASSDLSTRPPNLADVCEEGYASETATVNRTDLGPAQQTVLQPTLEVLLLNCAGDLDEEMQDRLRRVPAFLLGKPLGPEDSSRLCVYIERFEVVLEVPLSEVPRCQGQETGVDRGAQPVAPHILAAMKEAARRTTPVLESRLR